MSSQNTPKKNAKAPQINDDVQVNTQAAPAPESAPVIRRNMTGTKKIFTDLYKLSVAMVVKHIGFDDNDHPETHTASFQKYEHTHPFRTFDRKGQKQTMCTPIGGHFHIVEWEESKDPTQPPKIKSVSGPKVMGKQKVKGRIVQMPVDANEYDDHTHDTEYLRTDEVTVSSTNIEAAKVVAIIAQKTAPLPGVQG